MDGEETEIIQDLPIYTDVMKAVIILVGGWLVTRIVLRVSRPALTRSLDSHSQTIAERFIFWGLIALFIVTALNQLGLELGIVLGAAGILTVALGFASQTSAANIISGLFIMGERSISIGDIIQVAGNTGEVLSIDWLSIKLRTFDNLFVRIPNESFIKSEVTNLSRFPIRRADVQVGIAYKEDIGVARNVLMQVADRNPLCLENPEPLIIMRGFGDSSIDIQFSVWAARENFLALRNSIYEDIKNAFDEAGIEIPFPHRSLYVGEATKPMPVAIVDAHEQRKP
ncbi:MAG: mechanosensitive ion channel family protein [Pseudomonadales bacterium]|nr:mechanosensitive ion channel family protein [Pseudomonadales bacterium]